MTAESYEGYHTPLVHSGRKGSGFMTGGRQAEATVMAATAAAAARPAVRTSNMILRRSGSLMDFNGELLLLFFQLTIRLIFFYFCCINCRLFTPFLVFGKRFQSALGFFNGAIKSVLSLCVCVSG